MQENSAPDSFITWSAISALAGITQRKIYTTSFYEPLYTNMYTILVGPPGLGKSFTINQIRKFYHEIGINLVSESITREGMIAQAIERSLDGTSALSAFPDEFSDFIRPSGRNMLEFLTTIFGCPDTWEYTTLRNSVKKLENSFINVLAGTTPSWMEDEFDITFTEKGFAARAYFLAESEPRFLKPRAIVTPDMERIREKLIIDLDHISKLEGEFKWPTEAMEWYDKWHATDYVKERQNTDYRLRGFVVRKPMHLQKLAMVLSLSERDKLSIDIPYLEEARDLLDKMSYSMAKAFSAVGRNEYASDLERIYYEIMQKGEMSKAMVVERNKSAMTLEKLEEQMATLLIMGYIKVEKKEGETWYVGIARTP